MSVLGPLSRVQHKSPVPAQSDQCLPTCRGRRAQRARQRSQRSVSPFAHRQQTVLATVAVAPAQDTSKPAPLEAQTISIDRERLEASYNLRSSLHYLERLFVETADEQRVKRSREATTSGPDSEGISGHCSNIGSPGHGRHSLTQRARRRSLRCFASRSSNIATLKSSACKADLDLSEESTNAVFLAGIRQRLVSDRDKVQRQSRDAASRDAVSMFLFAVGHIEVLSKEEEAQLALIYQRGLAAQQQLTELAEKLGRKATCEEAAQQLGVSSPNLVQQLFLNQIEARALLVQFNLRLVFNIARKYTNRGVEFRDLIPEGIEGLQRAITKFDPSKGFKLSTYATWWIRQAVSRAVCNHSRIIRVPVHVVEWNNKIKRAANQLREKQYADACISYAEIGAEIGLTAKQVSRYLQLSQPTHSLEDPVYSPSAQDKYAKLRTVADEVPAEEPYEMLDAERARNIEDDVNAALGTLLPRERNVLRLRYGMHDKEDGLSMTLCDVSAAYGLSKERIRQIEDRALTKLKAPWRTKILEHSLVHQ